MVIRALVSGNVFSHWQLVMNQFNQEGAMNEVLLEGLAVGFPVDRLHISGSPVVALHDILADSW
jgi:hypothetical protein